jgi:hypothetical protein
MPRPGVAKIVDGPGAIVVDAAAALEEVYGELFNVDVDGRANNAAAAAAALFFAFVAEDDDAGRPPEEDEDPPPKRASRFEDASFL